MCGINPEDNTVVLSEERELFSSEAYVSQFNWISGETPDVPVRCKVKVRYSQKEHMASVIPDCAEASIFITVLLHKHEL